MAATALMFACYTGHVEVVRKLLAAFYGAAGGGVALLAASQFGSGYLVGHFLHMGVSVDVRDMNGWTALMTAGQNGHEAVVKELLGKGASMDVKDKHGWTALMLAIEKSPCVGGEGAAGERCEHQPADERRFHIADDCMLPWQ
jgi:ankyrin repeat protein